MTIGGRRRHLKPGLWSLLSTESKIVLSGGRTEEKVEVYVSQGGLVEIGSLTVVRFWILF